VERTRCNRNVLVFSLADSTSNGVVEYDRNGNTPTITRVDVEGQTHYQISNCDQIDKIRRWVGATSESDGYIIELSTADEGTIDAYGIESYELSHPEWVQMLNSPDTFRFLHTPSSAAFSMKVCVRYRESVADLITDDRQPTDTSAPALTTGSGLSDMAINTISNLTTNTSWDFKVIAGGATNPNTFQWRKNTGDWSDTANMTTTAQLISDNLYVSWGALTGHTANDVWTYYLDDYKTPSIPLLYRQYLIPGIVAQLLIIDGDTRAGVYAEAYQAGIVEVLNKQMRVTPNKPPLIRQNYQGAGW